MNKSFVPFIVTLFFSLPAFSENVTGLFKTETSDRGGYLIVEMGPCNKNNKLTCGVIKEALWEDNGSVIDNYEHINKPIVWGMKNTSPGKFKKGKIWRPTDDKTFNSKMEYRENDLIVSGCILMLCSSQTWSKIK